MFILDTKWKLLDFSRQVGISREDLYPMYVYQMKYQARSVTLLYPQTPETGSRLLDFYSAGDGFHVLVRFVDVLHIRESLEALREQLENS